MSLSRNSLVAVLAAMGLILLIGCAKKEAMTETDTATTTVTETGTTGTATTSMAGSTDTAMAGNALSATASTTDTTATAAVKYGTLTTKRDKWGHVDDVNVTIKFDGNKVIATPDPAEVNAEREKEPGKPTTITWTADPGVKLHVKVLKPANAPSCITGNEDVPCSPDNKCSAQLNPAIHKLPKSTVAVNCKVKIWKDGMSEPADPEVIVDNCCP